MAPFDPRDVANMNDAMPTIGARLHHLPFCELRFSKTHRFGSLRAYLKAKPLDSLVGWDSLTWRPLISLRKHRWRVLLSMASRF